MSGCSAACDGYMYFGIQHGQGANTGECRCSNSLSQATQYGTATDCEGAGTGGSWANDLYRNQAGDLGLLVTSILVKCLRMSIVGVE